MTECQTQGGVLSFVFVSITQDTRLQRQPCCSVIPGLWITPAGVPAAQVHVVATATITGLVYCDHLTQTNLIPEGFASFWDLIARFREMYYSKLR